ncbi:type II toxin-antitoxin system RelB/DinJ family antitoxin [Dethiosulfovibrio sp. F2B]|uniref:type II toxin-antitoxin system RelB/DinJ family antitoxin n=1 Tax=Dethiosulfovibrio faecalis TaxID=2720018 RepID=UPI001F1EA553|nr:type II toxin-antitoxin system RelB/DinJ family antitoxin [Dethiosulfovibrio faecalis]MCF4152652.1 type II toxin-antitoxin system RelB/DinJ family antitoxin [Dethiosulfovibrio faecalis]
MGKVLVQAKIDDGIKNEAVEIFQTLGIDTASAIRMFFHSVVNEGGLPFDLKVKDPFYSPANMERLRKSIASLEAGKGSSHELVGTEDDKDLV